MKFVYPTVTTLVPANVGIVANAPNKAGAEAFVEFLLSPAGQEVLLEPTHPPPAGQPGDLRQGAGRTIRTRSRTSTCRALVKFDVELSESAQRRRRRAVRPAHHLPARALKAATKAIHEADAALAKKDNAQARALVKEARDLIAAMPVTDAQAASPEIAGAFTGGKEKGARQAELEQQWAAFAKETLRAGEGQGRGGAEARPLSRRGASPAGAHGDRRCRPLGRAIARRPGQVALALAHRAVPARCSWSCRWRRWSTSPSPRRARGAFTLVNFLDFARTDLFVRSFWNSLYVSAMSVVLVVGCSRCRSPTSRRASSSAAPLLIQTLGFLPLIMPPFVGAVAMQLLFGRNGTRQPAARRLVRLQDPASWKG